MLFLIFPVALAARPQLAELRVTRQGSSVNIRVTVHNPESRKRGPFRIALSARRGRWGPFLPLRSYHVPVLPPHHKACRDFFDANSVILRVLARQGTLQVKASISAPGWKDIEQVTDFDLAPTQKGH